MIYHIAMLVYQSVIDNTLRRLINVNNPPFFYKSKKHGLGFLICYQTLNPKRNPGQKHVYLLITPLFNGSFSGERITAVPLSLADYMITSK